MRFFPLLGMLLLTAALSLGELPGAWAAQPEKQTSARKKTQVQARTPANPAPKPSPAAEAPLLQKISWTGKGARGSVLIELSRKVPYTYSYLPAEPGKKLRPRILVSLPKLTPISGVKASVIPKYLPVSRIRTALSSKKTQIILDCDDVGAYAVSVHKNAPFTLRIEVSQAQDIKGGTAVPVQETKGKPEKTKPAGTLLEQLGLTVETVMLDAGHGGKDPGTMANDIVERQFTLKMAKLIGTQLRAKGFTVLYTRTGNSFLSLEDRTAAANVKKADLFLSLHANANTDATVQGLETYYLDMAKTSGAATVAARENGVSAKNVSDLQFILTDLMLDSKMEESHDLALCIQKGILGQLAKGKYRYHDNGVRSAPFYVLTGARMPSVLVEFGYVTNKDDADKLSSDAFLQQQAAGLVDGIVAYKSKLARLAPGKK